MVDDTQQSAMDELYRDFILDHYRNPRNSGTLEHPDASFEDLNPLCGDKIRVDLQIRDGIIEDVKFSGRGCAISQASASLLTEQIKGKPVSFASHVTKEDVLANLGISVSAARLKCALLGLSVLNGALDSKKQPD